MSTIDPKPVVSSWHWRRGLPAFASLAMFYLSPTALAAPLPAPGPANIETTFSIESDSRLLLAPANAIMAEDEYMVILDENTVVDLEETMKNLIQGVNDQHPGMEAEAMDDPWNINDEFIGQALKMTKEQAQSMSLMEGVKFIEQNEIHIMDIDDDDTSEYAAGDGTSANLFNEQEDVPWGLDRIDQREGLSGNPGKYTYEYTGKGVTVYVVDTGVLSTHEEFEHEGVNRVSRPEENGEIMHFSKGGKNREDCDRPQKDGPQAHGTHVAGTIGGRKYGVAKEVNLVDVNVYDCKGGNGGTKQAIDAFNWILKNHPSESGRAVINYSSGGHSRTEAMKKPIEALIKSGIVFVTTPGNDGTDGCEFFPGGFVKEIPDMISVGAVDNKDRIWVTYKGEYKGKNWYDPEDGSRCINPNECDSENKDLIRRGTGWGKCVDIFAPGVDVLSASIFRGCGNTCKFEKSGTSMAAPHVSGVAALILEEHPDWTPKQVKAEIISRSTKNKMKADVKKRTKARKQNGEREMRLKRLEESKNRILFALNLTPEPTPAPTRSPTPSPTRLPTSRPTRSPVTSRPTRLPVTPRPTRPPKTPRPTRSPVTPRPTRSPVTPRPTRSPVTPRPTRSPVTPKPTPPPGEPTTDYPTWSPTGSPSKYPTFNPTTKIPTWSPTTDYPTWSPTTDYPTGSPTTDYPTWSPTTDYPTRSPIDGPSLSPAEDTTEWPTFAPATYYPTFAPATYYPTFSPSKRPTKRRKESKHTKFSKESKHTKSSKESKHTKSSKESKHTKSSKGSKHTKSSKGSKLAKSSKRSRLSNGGAASTVKYGFSYPDKPLFQ